MEFELSRRQLSNLSKFFLDLAKGVLLATLIGPAITNIFDIFRQFQSFTLGLILVYFSLRIDNRIEQI